MDSEVLTLLLTARYVGSPAFNSLGKDLDVLTSKANGLAKTGAAISAVGTLVTAATVGIAAAAYESIKRASQYQDAIQRMVAAGVIATNQQQALSDAIMKTSDTYGQNSTDIAKSLYFVTTTMDGLGYSISKNKTIAKEFFNEIIPNMGALVMASGHGLPGSISWMQAAQDVTHVAGAMNVPFKDWSTMMGSMDVTETFAGLSQKQLLQAVLRAAPSARLLGVNYQDLFAAMGAAATAGIPGAREGTQWGSGFRTLLGNKTAQKDLALLGINPHQFFDKKGNLVDQGTIMSTIYDKLAGVSDPVKRFTLQQGIFGAVGNRSMGLLAQPSTLAIYERLLNREKSNPVGFMLQDALKQTHTFAGSVAILGAAIDNLMKTVGGPLRDALQPFIDKLSKAIINLTNFLSGAGGQKFLKNLPGIVLGTIGTGAVLGPGMTYGGGLLRDWATSQGAKHDASLLRFNKANDSAMLRGSIMQDMTNMRLGFFDQRIAAATKAALTSGGLAPKALENEMGRQRISLLESLGVIDKTGKGGIAIRGKDPLLQGLLKDYYNAKGPAAGLASRRTWDYLNTNWDSVAKAYGFDPAKGPVEADVQKMLLGQKGQGALSRIESLKMSRAQAELSGKMQLSNFLSTATQNMPEVAKTPGELAKSFFKDFGGKVWGFGQALSPYNLAKKGGSAALDVAKGVPGFVKAIPGGIASAFRFLKNLPKAAISGLVDLFKGIGPALMTAIPAILGFGSALLPIIAVVLLVVGAVTALVLIFLNFRKQAEAVGKSMLSGLMPIFKFVFGFIQNTLQMVGKTWSDHKKQIDGAILGLLAAFKSALPFFQVVFAVIGTIIGVVVRVVGYLVGAFIDALPGIIGFFSAIFKVLGDLGRIIIDVVHGNWSQAWKDAQTLLGHAKDGILSLLGGLWSFITGIFGRLWTDIGPALGDLWNNHIGPFFASLPGKIGDLLGGLGSGVGNLLGNIFGGGGGGTGGMASAGTSIAAAISRNLTPALTRLWTDHLQPFFVSIPGKIIAALGGLITLSGKFWGLWVNTILPALGRLWTNVLWPFLQGLPGRVVKGLGDLWVTVGNSWQNSQSRIAAGLNNLWFHVLLPFLQSLPGRVSSFGGMLSDALLSLFGVGTTPASAHVTRKFYHDNSLNNSPSKTSSKIPNANRVGGLAANQGVDSIISAAKKKGPTIRSVLDNIWTTYILPWLLSLPDKITKAMGAFEKAWDKDWKKIQPIVNKALLGLWNNVLLPFIEKTLPPLLRGALNWLWTNVFKPFFQSLPGKILGLLGQLITSLPGFFMNLGKVLDKAVTGLENGVYTAFKTLGQKMVDGLTAGMAGMQQAIRNATKNIPVVGGVINIATGPTIHTGKHASGGYIRHSMLSWVGEKGPELMMLPGGSRIYSNADSMAMLRHPLSGGGRMAQLRVVIPGLEHLGQQQRSVPERDKRTPAEEYLFARQVQAHREGIWDRYPNTSSQFDHTYRRAYQYYG